MLAAVPAAATAWSAATHAAEQGEEERDESSDDGDAEQRDQQPGQEADDAARRDGAADAAENAAQDRAADQREDEEDRQDLEQSRHARRGWTEFRLRQRLALDHAHDAVDAGIDAAVVVAALERRDDVLRDDPVRGRVRQRAFEPVPHFDAHAPVVACDEHEHAVVDLLAADLPLRDDADRVLLDLFRLRRRHDEDGDLAAPCLRERTQLRIQCGGLVRRERPGEVRDRCRECRHRCERLRMRGLERARKQDQQAREQRAAPARKGDRQEDGGQGVTPRRVDTARGGPQLVAGAAAGAGSAPAAGAAKSTVGGLAIAASFSTVKFGFTS